MRRSRGGGFCKLGTTQPGVCADIVYATLVLHIVPCQSSMAVWQLGSHPYLTKLVKDLHLHQYVKFA